MFSFVLYGRARSCIVFFGCVWSIRSCQVLYDILENYTILKPFIFLLRFWIRNSSISKLRKPKLWKSWQSIWNFGILNIKMARYHPPILHYKMLCVLRNKLVFDSSIGTSCRSARAKLPEMMGLSGILWFK